jgi:hypothetical protein
MDPNTLEQRPDWPKLRVRIGRFLELQAAQQNLDEATLASKMGYKTRLIRQVFTGRWRAPGRYEHVARTLGSSLETALETLLEHPLTNTTTHPERDPERDLLEHQNVTQNAHVEPPRDEHSDTLETTVPSTETCADLPTPDPSEHAPSPPSNTLDRHSKRGSKHASEPSQEHENMALTTPKSSTRNDDFDAHRGRLAAQLKELIEASPHNQTEWGRRIGLSASVVSSLLAARPKRRTHYDALAHVLGFMIDDEFELVARPKSSTPPPSSTSQQPHQHERSGLLTSAPATSAKPTRLELDDATLELVEWAAAQRGLEPKLWLTLAVAAYHEAHASH